MVIPFDQIIEHCYCCPLNAAGYLVSLEIFDEQVH